MKEDELRKSAVCAMCGKGIASTNNITFWRVTLEHCALNVPALQRRAGLSMLCGSDQIAAVLGPDEDLAEIVSSRIIAICENCAVKNEPSVWELAEGE